APMRGTAFTNACEHRRMPSNTIRISITLLLATALAWGGVLAQEPAASRGPDDAAAAQTATTGTADPVPGADTPGDPRAAAPATAPAAVDDAEGAAADLAESRELARRLDGADGLSGVTVTVRDGVAELEGEVLDAGDRERAEQLVAQQ